MVVLVRVDQAVVVQGIPAVLALRHAAELRSVRAAQPDLARLRRAEARPAAPRAAGADASSIALERQRVVELRPQRQQFLVAALRVYPVGQQDGVAVPFPVNPE